MIVSMGKDLIFSPSDSRQGIFRIHEEQQEKAEEEQAERVYDIMDRLPTFWQMNDSASEHMLTR